MQTVKEYLEYITTSLTGYYSKAEAKKIAEWLLMDILSIQKRYELVQNYQSEILDPILRKQIQQKFKRLLRHEPIQYVLHKAWFYGEEFYVSRDTLIPRPETEELCHYLIHHFPKDSSLKMIDMGTGSGCIPITIKKYFPDWIVMGTDISYRTLKVASCNAAKHQTEVIFLLDDMLNSKLSELVENFDLLVSNPPYIPLSEKNQMKEHVVDYEPHVALFVPNENPLLFYKAIIQLAQKILKPQGFIFVEIHENLARQALQLFEDAQYQAFLFHDINQKPRFIKAQRL